MDLDTLKEIDWHEAAGYFYTHGRADPHDREAYIACMLAPHLVSMVARLRYMAKTSELDPCIQSEMGIIRDKLEAM